MLQLLTKQWSNFAAAAPVHTLEFLRSADRGSVKLSLKDAILVGLKNNPGIEGERLEPNRAVEPRLGFALTQPLLRGFGLGLTTIFVRISENREEVSLLGYRTKLAQLIQRITEAYWAVTYATENVRV